MKELYSVFFLFLYLSISVNAQSGHQVLDYRTHVKVEKNKIIEEKWLEVQINTKQANDFSDIEIAHGEKDKFKLLEAVILDAEGKVVRKLKKKEIKTRNRNSNGAFYEDNLIEFFSLKWNRYPYRIRYGYQKIRDKYIYVTRWFPVIHTGAATKQASLRVEVPKDYGVTVDFSEAFQYDVDDQEDVAVHEWKMSGLQPIEREAYAPPFSEIVPSVAVVPRHFEYGEKGSFSDWASFGLWLEKMNEGLAELPDSEKAKVDRLLEGTENVREKVAKLYHYMQDHTRYVNVAIDIGGLKPYPASYVCQKKYGDCKALTIYMKALLEYAGIPAYYTTIYGSDNPPLIKATFPSQQFNHVILAVPMASDTLWLENTANYLPVGYLGTFTQGRYGLLVDDANSRLVKTPELKPAQTLESSKYTLSLDLEGNGEAIVAKTLRGRSFERYRYFHHQGNEERLLDQIKADLGLPHAQIVKWQVVPTDRDSEQLSIAAKVSVSGQLRRVADVLAVNVFPLVEVSKREFTDRNQDIRISYPIHKTDTLVYQMPFLAQYKVELPQQVDIERDMGHYRERYELEGNEVKVVRRFLLMNGNYEKSESDVFYGFFQDIERAQHQSVIVLNPLYHEEN